MKTCTQCGVAKELSEYYFRRYYASECKECWKKRTRKRYAEKRDEILAQGRIYASEKRARIREATFAAYGGYVCACCGEKEKKFLTLDHIDNGGSKFRKSISKSGKGNTAGVHTYQWLMRHGFPAGYQVLCMNCNYGKRMNNGVCPHEVTRNDHPQVGVGSSDPKRTEPPLKLVVG